jgi:UDPglucose 6-dehydrogenase
VLGVARDVARAMNGYKVVVDKSTVPVGTAEKVREASAARPPIPSASSATPEFLKQGAAVDDFLRPIASSSAPTIRAAPR